MKNFAKIAAVAALVSTTALSAGAAQAATATGTATAEILQPVEVTAGDALNFGLIAADPTNAFNVSVNNAGARTCATGEFCTGTTTAASFDVTGAANQSVSVSLASASIVLTGAGDDMPVALTLSDTSLALGTGGANSFTVGGTLTVGADQTFGVYSGSFTVNVDYQ